MCKDDKFPLTLNINLQFYNIYSNKATKDNNFINTSNSFYMFRPTLTIFREVVKKERLLAN
jgi:hypothetical protein